MLAVSRIAFHMLPVHLWRPRLSKTSILCCPGVDECSMFWALISPKIGPGQQNRNRPIKKKSREPLVGEPGFLIGLTRFLKAVPDFGPGEPAFWGNFW